MGTESALDSSKPSAYMQQILLNNTSKDFGERCLKNCDITDMTFACIGGVDAFKIV